MSDLNSSDKKALKSGVWYTISRFLLKGMAFFTTPIITRMMSTTDYGLNSAYGTWASMLGYVVPLSLSSSIARAKIDYPDKIDEYSASMMVGSMTSITISYIAVLLFWDFFKDIFMMDIVYIHMMFLFMLIGCAMGAFQAQNHAHYRYKLSTTLSISISVIGTVMGITFTYFSTNKVLGHIIGGHVVSVIVNFFVFFLVMKRAKWRVNLGYIKYGLSYSLPLIPHALSMYLLSSSDKLVIQRLCGNEDVAFYNIGYTCAKVVSMLSNAVNEAMSPWLFDQMAAGENEKIKKVNQVYVALFVIATAGLLLVAPELVLILGGRAYMESQEVLMPVMAGCCCMFIYTLYINVERFLKKTISISIGTTVTAAVNLVLNYIFVDLYGYVAAAYTTLVCYLILLLYHYAMVKRAGYGHLYDNRLNLGCAFGISIYGLLVRLVYKSVLRYILLVIYVGVLLFLAIKYKNHVRSFLGKLLGKG